MSLGTASTVGIFSIATLCYHALGKSTNQLSPEDYPVGTTQLATACNNLDDGYHWIRPQVPELDEDDSDYPNIYVKCVDGYTLLDPSLMALDNFHHIKAYFSSYSDITDFMASSSLNDHQTWRNWFNVADEETKFMVSEDCSSCMETEDFGSSSTYYMTGNYNGCLWITKGYCDMDPDTLECYTCKTNTMSTELTGLCSHVEQDADRNVPHKHDSCVSNSYNQFPSLGSNGEFCVCYKPTESTVVAASEWQIPEEEETQTQDADTIVEIYASDFVSGTYRILSPGIYTVMEDIEFEMNAPTYDVEGDIGSPNGEGAWWPIENQEDMYMGAGGTFIGPYSMGFFAGFAVESDNVTIDLNGHELSMSKKFHHQQRWFSIIEIGSKSFISGQGPGFFGPYMTYANNVEIKNGIIGRSSHHGIHANGCNNVYIHDVVVKHFEVAGIALNGFESAIIEHVEVGPVYQEVPVMGVYTQARIMLPRLRSIAEDNPDGYVEFYGRDGKYTAQDLLDELTSQMDIMYEHNINGVDWEDIEDDEGRIVQARDVFENTNGLPSSSTCYGIFMNSYGASVFAISGSPGHSDGVVVNDVHIHGLYKDPWEVPRIALTKGPFNDIMDFTRHSSDGLRTANSKYIGSAYTDVQFGIHSLASDWAILGHSVLGSNDSVVDWISKGKPLDNPKMICNGDIMLHVTKGVFGLRMDNVYNASINALTINDLQNVGELGSYICGNYQSSSDGGHRNQNYPLQRGYTGTEVHAFSLVSSSAVIDNVIINNIVSARGDAMAIQLFPSNHIHFGTNIQISDIHAGAALDVNAIKALKSSDKFLPNKVPRACAITVWTYTDEDSGYYENKVTFDDVGAINAKCLTMHTDCSDSDFDGEAVAHLLDCDDSTLVDSEVYTMNNKDIYGKYIRPVSETHEKLFAIIENHPEPDFFPPRAFPEMHRQSKSVISVTLWCALIISVTVMLLAVVFYRNRTPMAQWNKTHGAGSEFQPLITGH